MFFLPSVFAQFDLNGLFPEGNAFRVVCPGGSGIQAQTNVYLSGNSIPANLSPNCPTLLKGDLKVVVNNIEGFPVSNVYVFVDEDNSPRAITDLVGVGIIEEVDYGSHNITLGYRLDENSTPLQVVRIIDLNSTKQVLNHSLLFPGQLGYGATYFATEASPQLIPFILLAAKVAVSLYSAYLFYEKAQEYCACVYPDPQSNFQCTNDFFNCGISPLQIAKTMFLGDQSCRDFYQRHHDNHNVCLDELVSLGVDAGVNLAGDVTGHVLVGAGKGVAVVDKFANQLSTPTYNALNSAFGSSFKLFSKTRNGVRYLKQNYQYVASIGIDLYGNIVSDQITVALEVGVNPSALNIAGTYFLKDFKLVISFAEQAELKLRTTNNPIIDENYYATGYNLLGKLNSQFYISSSLYTQLMNEYRNIAIIDPESNEQRLAVKEFFVDVIGVSDDRFLTNKPIARLFQIQSNIPLVDWKLANGDLLVVIDGMNFQTEKPVLNNKARAWQQFLPNAVIRVGILNVSDPISRQMIENDLRNSIIQIQPSFNQNNLVIEWI